MNIFLFFCIVINLGFFACCQGPEVRSGDLPQPITLTAGQEFTFTIRSGVGTADCVSVNYDDFVNDVAVDDIILVDGILYLILSVKRGVSIMYNVYRS